MSVGNLVQGEREFTVLSGIVSFVLRGVWSVRVEVDADEDLPIAEGVTSLFIAADNEGDPIELRGTIESVDATTSEGRATAIIVGGKGTLGKTLLPARTYQQAPFPVPVASIAIDAVEDAGETFDNDVALVSKTVTRWHRIEMTAAATLDRLAQRTGFGWRMNDEGVVQFVMESWPDANEDEAGFFFEGPEEAHDRTISGSVKRASIRPGTIVRGRKVEEVHYLLDGDGLRVLMRWGDGVGTGGLRGDHEVATQRCMPPMAYYAIHECTVRRQNNDGTLDVEADDSRIGLLTSVPYYPGIVGCKLNVADGERAIMTFFNGDETKPAIVGFTRLDVDPAAQEQPKAAARANDPVNVGTLAFAAVAGSGGIASIAVTYTPPVGANQLVTIAPGAPVSIDLTGVITEGSQEVFLRVNP